MAQNERMVNNQISQYELLNKKCNLSPVGIFNASEKY